MSSFCGALIMLGLLGLAALFFGLQAIVIGVLIAAVGAVFLTHRLAKE